MNKEKRNSHISLCNKHYWKNKNNKKSKSNKRWNKIENTCNIYMIKINKLSK